LKILVWFVTRRVVQCGRALRPVPDEIVVVEKNVGNVALVEPRTDSRS